MISHPVDWSGRREDSCGSTGQGRPRRRDSAEEAPRHARGKRSAWSANQQASFKERIRLRGLFQCHQLSGGRIQYSTKPKKNKKP